MTKKLNGINPLEKNALFEKTPATVEPVNNEPTEKRGRPRNDNIVREKGSKQGLQPGFKRATIIVKESLFEDLKRYCFAENISIKDAVSDMIETGLNEYKRTHELPERNAKE